MPDSKKTMDVLDGSKITDLVQNEHVFNKFVDHKFEELDQNRDGKLSVKELVPAVADISAALGLPAQGSSSNSDHIYDEVLGEFTQGKDGQVGKSEFKEVLSDILLGVAAGLKREPIVILRIDGEDLQGFVGGAQFEAEALSIFSELVDARDIQECLDMAISKLTVEHGMPPPSDPWVRSNIVEPSLQLSRYESRESISQEILLEAFKKTVEDMVVRLKEQPVIVAHSGNTFDGSGIKRMLFNKYELNKTMESTWMSLPKNEEGMLLRDYLRVALDVIAPAVGLPPYGAVEQIDVITSEVFKMVKAEEGGAVEQEEFNKLMLEILSTIMLQLQGSPVTVTANAVINEPHTSTFLSPSH